MWGSRPVRMCGVADRAGAATSVAPGQSAAAEVQLSSLYPYRLEGPGLSHVTLMLESVMLSDPLATWKPVTLAGHGNGVGCGVGVAVGEGRGRRGLGVGLDTLQLSP